MTKDKVNQTIFTHKFVLVRPEKLNDCNTKTCTRNHVEFFLHFLWAQFKSLRNVEHESVVDSCGKGVSRLGSETFSVLALKISELLLLFF